MLDPEYIDQALELVPVVHPLSVLGEFKDAATETAFRQAGTAAFLRRAKVGLFTILAMHICVLAYTVLRVPLFFDVDEAAVAAHLAAVAIDAAQIAAIFLIPSLFARNGVVFFIAPIVATVALTHGYTLAFVHFDNVRIGAIVGISATAIGIGGTLPMLAVLGIGFGGIIVCHVVASILHDGTMAETAGVTHGDPLADTTVVFIFCLVIVPFLLTQASTMRNAFALDRMTGDAVGRVDKLIENVLPPSIIKQLRSLTPPQSGAARDVTQVAGRMIMDSWKDAVVVATDVVGFTSFCSTTATSTVFSTITSLVDAFDGITAKHGMQKLAVIGDAYIALIDVDGLSTSARRAKVEQVAREMLAEAKRTGLSIRLGAASGSASAGLIGPHSLPVYRAWGDAYDRAQEIEGSGVLGRASVDAATAASLGLGEGDFGEEGVFARV